MIDDLIQRLDLFSSDPVLGGVIEEAKGRIEQIEADAERYRWLCEQNEKGVGFFHLAFAARNIMNWKTKTEIDDGIDRARGDMK